MAVKTIKNDSDFNKHIKSNKFVLATFMEEDTMLEVCRLETFQLLIWNIFTRPTCQMLWRLWRRWATSRWFLPRHLRPVLSTTSRITNFQHSYFSRWNRIFLYGETAIIINQNVPPGHDRDGQVGHRFILSTTKRRWSHHGKIQTNNFDFYKI